MKIKLKISLIILSAFLFNQSFSQTKGRPSLGIGVDFGIPAGKLNTTQKIGVGGTAKAAFPVTTNGDFTLSAGYISFSGDEYKEGSQTIKSAALNTIPIKAGFRYKFTPQGFYLEPQLGYTSLSTPGGSSAKGGFTYAANVGYFLGSNFDVSARYEAINKEGGNLPFVGLRLGYNFNL